MSAGETEVGERERERQLDTQTGVERERYGGKERKIETQTGIGEREKDSITDRNKGNKEKETWWDREKDRNTDRSGGERKIDAPTGEARETWWFYLFLSHHIFLSPPLLYVFLSFSLSPTLSLNYVSILNNYLIS